MASMYPMPQEASAASSQEAEAASTANVEAAQAPAAVAESDIFDDADSPAEQTGAQPNTNERIEEVMAASSMAEAELDALD